MRCALGWLVSIAVFTGIAIASDFESLQGSWKLALAVHDGKPVTGAGLNVKLRVDGNRVSVDQVGSGTFTLDENAKPKTVDISISEGPNQGKNALGIYEIRAGN